MPLDYEFYNSTNTEVPSTVIVEHNNLKMVLDNQSNIEETQAKILEELAKQRAVLCVMYYWGYVDRTSLARALNQSSIF